jgi:hypothetical protein
MSDNILRGASGSIHLTEVRRLPSTCLDLRAVLILDAREYSGVGHWLDTSGNGWNSVLSGQVPFDSRVGGAPGFLFSGTTANSNGVSFDEPLLPAAGPYSFGAWLYRTGDAASNECQVAKTGDGTGERGVRFELMEGSDFRPAIFGQKATSGRLDWAWLQLRIAS